METTRFPNGRPNLATLIADYGYEVELHDHTDAYTARMRWVPLPDVVLCVEVEVERGMVPSFELVRVLEILADPTWAALARRVDDLRNFL